jgi:hypothetical protein
LAVEESVVAHFDSQSNQVVGCGHYTLQPDCFLINRGQFRSMVILWGVI